MRKRLLVAGALALMMLAASTGSALAEDVHVMPNGYVATCDWYGDECWCHWMPSDDWMQVDPNLNWEHAGG